MLTGPDLGKAIEAARILKKVTKKALAEHFKVSPPAIQDWVKRGTIDKSRLPDLWDYFKEVAGPEHWGLKSFSANTSGYDRAAPTALTAMEPPPGTPLKAGSFSLAARLDALKEPEHRRIAYALMAQVLDQYEALEAKASAPRPATKSSPRGARSPSRQPAR